MPGQNEAIVQQVVAKIPWGHNVRRLEMTKAVEERTWYAGQTIQHGWSRNVLVHHIENGLFHRQGKALTNFDRTLPSPQSELAQQLLKDPTTTCHGDWQDLVDTLRPTVT